MTEYQGTIERVRAATGADEDLDRAIEDFLGIGRHPFVHRGWLDNSFTGSTDAALALAEKLLPGRWNELLRWALDMLWHDHAPNMPMALLPKYIILATLLALQSQEPK